MPPVTKPATKPVSKLMGSASKMSGNRPILYPKYEVKICCLPTDGAEYDGPLTYDIVKKLLGWETEIEYAARLMAIDPKTKESKCKFGDDFLLKNYAKDKVRCWNNPKNRPYDATRAKMYAQDILNKRWEMNCETIIIGTTGLIISAQHRLTGFMLAIEEWRATKLKGGAKGHWHEIWPDEPVLESMIAFGCKEDPRIIRTIDNVKPRTLADTIYTSPMFEKLDAEERDECSRMMDLATDLLWKRTKQADAWSPYQTHSSSLDFLDKHPKIKACTKHIFDNNRNRVISRSGLSAGKSVAMMYLMGCSGTDEEDYYFPGSQKKESQLNWDNWDKALEFWNNYVDSKNEQFEVLRNVIGALADPNTGANVPQTVYQMVLCKAWNVFIAGEEFTEENLSIKDNTAWSEAKERTIIVEEPTVGGIDCGVVKGGGEEDEVLPSPEELEAQKEAEKAASLQRKKDAIKQAKKPKEETAEEEEAPNPIVEAKTKAATKGNSPFSVEEREALVKQMQPKSSVPMRGPNNEQIKPKAPKKPTLAPK